MAVRRNETPGPQSSGAAAGGDGSAPGAAAAEVAPGVAAAEVAPEAAEVAAAPEAAEVAAAPAQPSAEVAPEAAEVASALAAARAELVHLGDVIVLRDREIAALKEQIAQMTPKPTGIRLVAPHGFVDEDGTHYWAAGDVVTEAVARMLSSRGASLEIF